MRTPLKIAAASAVAAAGCFAAVALGHTPTSEVTCTGVTFSYYNFTAGEHRAVETITDGTVIYTGPFVFQGEFATHTIVVNLSGDRVVHALATWTDDGGGSYDSGPVHVVCAPPVTVTVAVPTPGPTTTVTTPGAPVPGPTVTVAGPPVPGPTSTVERVVPGKTVTVKTPGKTVTVKSKPKLIVKTHKLVVLKTKWRTRTVTVTKTVTKTKTTPRFLGRSR